MTEEWYFDGGHAIVTDTTTDGTHADFCIGGPDGAQLGDAVDIRVVFAERILILAKLLWAANFEVKSLRGAAFETGAAEARGWHEGYAACRERILSMVDSEAI